ncbi:MAG: 5-(carboxyamino)imidazole ribonucleotide mutase [bacterium]
MNSKSDDPLGGAPNSKLKTDKLLVGIVMGSKSDLPVVEETSKLLDQFEIGHEMRVISAHRTPELAHQYAKEAEKRGLEVIIAAASGAAHLAGVIASFTPLPVIGIPLEGRTMGGLDSLYSTVQMPAGVPVATVAIGQAGAKNAAILAAQILGVKFSYLRDKVRAYKGEMAEIIEKE